MSLFLRYPLRSLARGGQRTLLALFCVAVGVMAIVGVQLAGVMVSGTLLSSVREINGGDVSLSGEGQSWSEQEIGQLDQLRQQGVITDWTAITDLGLVSARRGDALPKQTGVRVVDPARYPLVGSPVLSKTTGPGFQELLRVTGNAVISEEVEALLDAHLGDRYTVSSELGPFDVSIVGVVQDSGFTDAFVMYVSRETATQQAQLPLRYTSAFVLTSDQKAAKAALIRLYPGATVTTYEELLASQKENVKGIDTVLKVTGLLALLVGGVGILNTMQVLLSRRRVEIAMLKTAGYHRRELYLLFGLEAAWLGLAGGLLGAFLGVVVSYGVKTLLENFLLLHLPFVIDGEVVAGGLLVGLATALIFGLIPIVRAAGVRPLAVLRDLDEHHSWGSTAASAGLLAVVAVLFILLSSAILGDLGSAIKLVGAAGVGLGVLYVGFLAVASIIGILPVPDRFSIRHLLLVTAAVLVSVVILFLAPAVGVLLLAFALAGYLVVLLPAPLRASVKLAFHGIGRARVRTAGTLLALFVGVFAIGLIVILAQDVREKLDEFLASSKTFNVAAITQVQRAHLIEAAIPQLPGRPEYQQSDYLVVNPVAIAGLPVGAFVEAAQQQDPSFEPRLVTFIDGFDVTGNLPPGRIARDGAGNDLGRLLAPSDAGTRNAVGPAELARRPWNLAPGSTITLANPYTQQVATITLVGFYDQLGTNGGISYGGLVADRSLVDGLGGPAAARVFVFKIDPQRTTDAVRILADADPQAQILDIANFAAVIDRFLRNLISLLLALASLALASGMVIIANAVALAMLERRREIGILKSVGFGSTSILTEVLLEFGIVGGVAGAAGIVLMSIAAGVIVKVTQVEMPVPVALSLAVVGFGAAVAVTTAALVAYAPTRVRPLEVLRYE